MFSLDPSLTARLRALYRLSKDPANEHEAALAADRMRALLAKHNLTLGDLTTESESTEEPARCGARFPAYYTPLANACKCLFDVEWFFSRRRINDALFREIVFCGLPQNVATALLSFDYFIDAVRSLALRRDDLRSRRQYHSYQRGASCRIASEAFRLKRQADSSPETTALVHIGSAVARRHLEKHKLKAATCRKWRVNKSFLKGWLDGASVDLARAGRKQVDA